MLPKDELAAYDALVNAQLRKAGIDPESPLAEAQRAYVRAWFERERSRAECICHPERDLNSHYPGCPYYLESDND